jgi:alpha-ketoglutarate-dependent taurine dioxygenase
VCPLELGDVSVNYITVPPSPCIENCTADRTAIPHNKSTMAIKSQIEVRPLADKALGAEVRNADLENLSHADFDVIRRALYTHQVLLFKGQQGFSPAGQYELTRRFDPEATNYGHGKTLDQKKSVLHPDLKTVPHQTQVQVLQSMRASKTSA